jgi:predicted nucleic acid-binding protein
MLYMDSSSFLKLFLHEAESAAVHEAVESEDAIVISMLTQLETETQLRAALLGGRLTKYRYRKVFADYEEAVTMSPFLLRALPGSVFTTAVRIHRDHPELHCRSLDRLQIAAMNELGIKRLMCHDTRLCAVATALGCDVLRPE